MCLSLSVILNQFAPCFSHAPVFIESRPPRPTFVALPPPSLPLYGPQVPIVSASVKSPAVIAPPAPVSVPLPPVTRARIGVKTVIRPPPQLLQEPVSVPVFEQQEVVINIDNNKSFTCNNLLVL